jgi:hypothetical protein
MKLRLSLLASVPLALLVLGAVPADAAEQLKTHKSPLFTIQLPADWAQVKSSPTNWTWKSQGGNYVLGITVYPDNKEPLADLGERVLKVFLKDSKDAMIMQKRIQPEDGKDIFYAVVKATRSYENVTQEYLTMRMLIRSDVLQQMLSVSLSVSGEQAEAFGKMCEHVIESLTLIPVKK